MTKLFALVAAMVVAGAAAHATPTIVNLSASATPGAANGGPVTQANGGPTANPIVLSFGPGTYSVSLAGIAGGGAYDAYSVATPASSNYTEQYAGFSIDGVATLIQPITPQRYASASAALIAYQAAGPLTFTLTSTKNVSFYIEDAASLYFADDTGGVSFAVNQVPEPASLVVIGSAIAGLGLIRRRRNNAA